MANNFLKYSELTYDEILTQIKDKLNSDERFANFKESAIAQTMVEIFAATADLINYYIERRAEESFFDTAKLRSSVLLLARGLGYVIQRSIPAECFIKIKLKGDWTLYNLNDQTTIQIPAHSVFSFEGTNFVLKNSLILNYVDFKNVLVDDNAETDYILKDYKDNDIELIQGEIKEKVFEGNTNPQIGSNFQLYRIEDTEFSNRYGDEDFDNPITKVWVGNTKSDETEYSINRRSLIDWNVINAANSGEVVNVCVLRTSVSEGVELLFGDGKFAQVGAQTSAQGAQNYNDNIYVQYLATKGQESNRVGVKNKKIQFSGKVYTSNGEDVTSKVEFYFLTNINGGADMEDIDSIRMNAPNIYYSLDRLVSKRDYTNYLKSLTSPINVKNAIAWGEQEELTKSGRTAMLNMFNVIFFSVIGPLYQTDISPYYSKNKFNGLKESVLDFDFYEDEINERNYFNVFVRNNNSKYTNLIQQLKDYETTAYIWKINGNTLDTDKNGNYFSINYGENFILTVNYTSDVAANNISLSKSTTVQLDVTSLNVLDYDNAMIQLSYLLKNALLSVIDERGISKFQNSNYDELAFPDIEVNYDSVNKRINLVHKQNTPAYISSFAGVSELSLDSSEDIGLSVSVASLVSVEKQLSDKIINVVNDIQDRSQVTSRTIYLSPVVQNINLVGTVYLKDLYDLGTEKINIEDAIYSWANNNMDFNTPVYISNMIEIVENFPSVIYADIRFVPDVPINPNGESWINISSSLAPALSGVNNDIKNFIYILVSIIILDYLQSAINNFQYDTYGSDEKNLSYTPYTPDLSLNVQSYQYGWARDINERTFLEVLAKNLYNNFKTILYGTMREFADSDNFINFISDIRKEYLEIIRYNMLDTKGNIAEDVQLDSNNKSIKGGYSLGNEIVKINCVLNYEYKR
jgi:hypothetical protein